jgi:hypothetical protein
MCSSVENADEVPILTLTLTLTPEPYPKFESPFDLSKEIRLEKIRRDETGRDHDHDNTR